MWEIPHMKQIRRVLERTSNLADPPEVLGIDEAKLCRKRKKLGLE